MKPKLNYNGSDALSGKMLLVRLIENFEFDAYFRRVRKRIRIQPPVGLRKGLE